MSSEGSDGEQTYYGRFIEPSITRIADALSISLRAVPQQIDPRLLAMVFFGSHFFIALDARYRNDSRESAEMSQHLVDLLAYGFAARPADIP
jgi:hypothetical protein